MVKRAASLYACESGPGYLKKQGRKLFQVFSQVKVPPPVNTATTLASALVKSLVEEIDFNVTRARAGTTCAMSFPLIESEPDASREGCLQFSL